MDFPTPANSAKAVISGNRITFSYLDSYSQPQTETKPLLKPEQIVKMVKARDRRFDEQQPPGARESDTSRAERKWIVAHPPQILFDAWDLADEETKQEMATMFDPESHHGISDPAWLKTHAKGTDTMIGDNGKTLD